MATYQASGGGAKRQLSADLAGAGPPAKKKRVKQTARASEDDTASQRGDSSSSEDCTSSSEAEVDEVEKQPIQRRAATSAKKSIRKAVSHGSVPDKAPVLKGTHGEEAKLFEKSRRKKHFTELDNQGEVSQKRKITGFKQDDLEEDEDLLHSHFVRAFSNSVHYIPS